MLARFAPISRRGVSVDVVERDGDLVWLDACLRREDRLHEDDAGAHDHAFDIERLRVFVTSARAPHSDDRLYAPIRPQAGPNPTG